MSGVMEMKMTKYLPILALLALPACLSGGGESTVSGVSNMNAEFGGLLNGVRMGSGASSVTYDSRLGRAAQIHADDMVNRGYLTVTIPGTVGNNNGMQDVGDLVTAQGYTWSFIAQLVEQGD